MNALESAIYKYRDEASTRLGAFIAPADQESLTSVLTKMEDWLYDEGFDAEKDVYDGKLKEITDQFKGPEERVKEAELRPEAFKALETAIELFAKFAASA